MADDVSDKLRKMSDFRTVVLTSIISALALVVGLFWNDAVKSTIEQIVPQGEGLFYKFIAAVIATIIVVIIIYVLMRWHMFSEKMAEKKNRKQKTG